ncbi:MAG TPA: hypothetical protein ENF42_04240 [Candidatus Bathyarchaeota archaeon]|nr:hypothetical protein [Candidatus Bathyarchaeota archaeon]
MVNGTFIHASSMEGNYLHVWYPVALAEFGNCRKCKGKYIIDCYIASKTGSPIARMLLIRKLNGGINLSPSMPVDAPMLLHTGCSISDFMSDVRNLNDLLENEKEAIRKLMEEDPRKYENIKVPKSILYFPFRAHNINIKEAIAKTNLSLLKDIMKTICANKNIPPTGWYPAYILLSMDRDSNTVYIHEGNKKVRSQVHEVYLFKKKIIETLLKELGMT